jgi:glycosyltransferase involved in cell wall biosynthesis
VLHAPSKRWTKGTDRILPVLTDLHERHVIELRLAESVPWTDMRQMVHAADIVVDQFTTGAYGTLSCEAMAAGRPVIAAISETTRLATGGELPIVHATAETLAEAVEGLIEDREGAVKIGLRSRDFARAYHGGAWTARILAEFLG